MTSEMIFDTKQYMEVFNPQEEAIKSTFLMRSAGFRTFGFGEFPQLSTKQWSQALPLEHVFHALKMDKDYSAFENCQTVVDGARVSPYSIHTTDLLGVSLPPRYLGQYHFANEWNNLGYGRVRTDTSMYGLGELAKPSATFKPLQILKNEKNEPLGAVSGIIDTGRTQKLWFSRPIGPMDGFDWFLVERFFSDYRSQDLECIPIIKEIPWGYDSACTMRIDCDEAVASGRALFELYKSHGLPFGLAIKTQQELLPEDLQLIRDVIAAGGTVVSHSHTHAPDWGGSMESAQKEVEDSHAVLKSLKIDGINYRYVVSPFHQNTRGAVKGLQAAGIEMFVSGIIANDPEYLMARAGQVPWIMGIYSHSQQSMLHGDCYHQAGNSWDQYKKAFDTAKLTETFYGFLDHPFSSYKYGWVTEEERLGVHAEFIKYIKSHNVWWASLERALDFLASKQESQTWLENGELKFRRSKKAHHKNLPDFCIRWKGKDYRASEFEVL